jgi:D-alanyl-D-alanine dipeptidase
MLKERTRPAGRWRRLGLAAAIGALSWMAPGAGAAELPAGFVHLARVNADIVQDIRYAGRDNFLGRPLPGYATASCILTHAAADALAAAAARLSEKGLRLVVHDCYRPRQAVAAMVAWTRVGGPPDPRWYPAVRREQLVAKGYIGARSAHARGSTVDVSVLAADGAENGATSACGAVLRGSLDFGTGFDCFDPASRTASRAVGDAARANRRMLVAAMRAAGFRNYAGEWWHFTLVAEPYPQKTFDFPITAAP